MAACASAFTGARVAVPAASRRAAASPARAAAAAAAAAPVVVTTVSIPQTFADLKKNNQCAFIPFICAGDPNLDATEKALRILDDAGADIIELGVPYSDPLADGPVIQVRACLHNTNSLVLCWMCDDCHFPNSLSVSCRCRMDNRDYECPVVVI
jgi:hypothetical protein